MQPKHLEVAQEFVAQRFVLRNQQRRYGARERRETRLWRRGTSEHCSEPEERALSDLFKRGSGLVSFLSLVISYVAEKSNFQYIAVAELV